MLNLQSFFHDDKSRNSRWDKCHSNCENKHCLESYKKLFNYLLFEKLNLPLVAFSKFDDSHVNLKGELDT